MGGLPTEASAGGLSARLLTSAHDAGRILVSIDVGTPCWKAQRAAIGVLQSVIAARMAIRARRELERLDDRILRDMGLARSPLIEALLRHRPRIRPAPESN